MATAKKASTAKKTTRKPKAKQAQSSMRSFVLTKDTPPFLQFRITHQTFYWLLLSGLILALGVWVLALNVKVQTMYDQIDQIHTNSEIPNSTSGKTE